MILMPFVKKNFRFLDACSYHRTGHVFMARGLEYVSIGEYTVPVIYVESKFDLVGQLPSFYRLFEGGDRQGLFVASSRTAEYLNANRARGDLYSCTTILSLNEDIRGRTIGPVLCASNDLGKMMEALEDQTVLYNMRKSLISRSVFIVQKTNNPEDFDWMTQIHAAYVGGK